MEKFKLYLASIFDMSIIYMSITEWDGHLRTLGLIIGIIVGALTIVKLILDIKGKVKK